MRYFDVQLGSGITDQSERIESPGNYLFFRTASSTTIPLRVKSERGGVDAILLAGEGIRLPEGQGRWYLETVPPGQVLTGQVVIGDGEYISQRFSGIVDISGASSINGALPITPHAAVAANAFKHFHVQNSGYSNPTPIMSTGSVSGAFWLWSIQATPPLVLRRCLVRKFASAAANHLVFRRLHFNVLVGSSPQWAFMNVFETKSGATSANLVSAKGIFGDTNVINTWPIYQSRSSNAEEIIDLPLPPDGLVFGAAPNTFQIFNNSQAADAGFELLAVHCTEL